MPVPGNKDEIMVDLLNIMSTLDKVKVALIISNRDNCIINMNNTAEQFTGWSLHECLGFDLDDIVKILETNNQTVLVSRQNTKTNVNISTTVHDYVGGTENCYITLIKNETPPPLMNDFLVVSEKNLRMIFDSLYDAIIIHDLYGNILDVNKKMREMYGLGSMNVTEMKVKEDLSAENNDFDELLKIWKGALVGENRLFEWKAKRPRDQSVFEVEVSISIISLHHQDAIMATIRDISEKKKTEQMIQYLSFHDKLTGLYNRASFEKELIRLDSEITLPLSIIMGDVNGLKLANDAFGHLAGDELLKLAADVFRKACNKDDIVARWGGDEFIVILPNTNIEAVSMICEKIHEGCLKAEMKPIFLSIGLGYATKNNKKQDIFDIIKEAETLMYSNKLKEGRANRDKIISVLLEKRVEWDHDIELMMKLCSLLGSALGFEGSKLEELRLLAYIHDIGKVSIPIDIIKKPSALSKEEWEIIKKHSEIGYRIASTYPEYAHFADCILTHHERFDGTGYPRKLQGEEIPIEARILAIVDAYDAMTSGRPYKVALSFNDALKEIELNAGTQFDPKLVSVFIELMKNNRFE